MRAGPSSRTRRTQKEYDRYSRTRTNDCDFCHFKAGESPVVGTSDKFWIVKNKFAYDIWDDTKVQDHLLLVPKRHVEGIHEFDSDEKTGLVELVSQYEQQGYSLYARAPKSHAKSVQHQHSHLIKLSTTFTKFRLHIRKPHVLIYK